MDVKIKLDGHVNRPAQSTPATSTPTGRSGCFRPSTSRQSKHAVPFSEPAPPALLAAGYQGHQMGSSPARQSARCLGCEC